MISLIILTAVINTLAQDVSDVDLLASLPSQSLECSLKFDRDFLATNEELAAAIEALIEENASEQAGASRRDRPCDSDEATEEETEADREDATTEDELQLRRALRGGKGRGRGGRRNRDVTLEAGATRPPRGDKPCDSDSDDTTEDSEDAVADDAGNGEELQLRRALRGGKGRGRGGRRDRDVTLEAGATRPPRGDKPCDSDSDDTTEDAEADDAATEDVQLRRALRGGKGRGRGGRRDRDVTLEAGATRPPRGDKPCDSDSDDSTDETESTGEPVTEGSLLRRLLRRDRDSSETDAEVAGETDATDEPCRRRDRGQGRRNRRKDTDTEMPEEETDGVARRALGGRGKRSRGLEAAISNGSIDFAGLTGEVVFGEVDEELESVPLTITVGGTSFNCDVEVRRGNKVSCRAISEDDFDLRVECAILADEE